MADIQGRQLLRLMAAMSPAFPTGAFSYSHGLERAVHDGLVTDRASLEVWLRDLIEHGSLRNDALLFAAAWKSNDAAPVAELGEALAGSRERWLETTLQGTAFAKAAMAWQEATTHPTAMPAPVAAGVFAKVQGIPLEASLDAFLQSFVSNLVQAALRLAPIGQTSGLHTLASLEPAILDAAERAAEASLDALGSATFLSEVSAMRHETQYSRIFRS